MFYACFLLTEAKYVVDTTSIYNIQPALVRLQRQTEGLDVNEELPVENGIHSAVSTPNNPETSATNYQPYVEDANPYNLYGYNDDSSYERNAKYNGFASAEANVERYNQDDYLDTAGYTHYKTGTSINLDGPKQLETITTNDFHREVEPYDVSDFEKSHKEEEQHAEVHYHQHKHLHKHNHKQEHVHKHQQKHKHDHGHNHDHYAQHEHKHDSQHKHAHQSEHKHIHKDEHHHKHHQDHKHSHYGSHKHNHKHHQEHKHDHRHGHKHSHHGNHKHSHHSEHKHNHHQIHKHHNQHHHTHQEQANHKHSHRHNDEHKHQHHNSHYHKHYQHKY